MTSTLRPWRRLGFDIVRAVELSRHGGGRAFRLDLGDGRIVKARVFTTARLARDVERLLATPGASACPRTIARHGHVLVSEFIPGVPLDEWLRRASGPDRRRMAREAGRLVAGIHRGSPPRGQVPTTSWYQRHLRSGMRAICRAALVTRDEADRLVAIGGPARARSGLTHGDICPENLVVTPSGALVAIDEERLALRPFAYDLARAVNRWPLDRALETAFLRGYADGGGDARGYRRWRTFWVATALATSARYRLKVAPGSLGPIVAAIRELAATIAPRRRRPGSRPARMRRSDRG